jgi:uncharacterized protein (TIGR02001 family)
MPSHFRPTWLGTLLALAAGLPAQAQIKTPVGILYPQVRYASDYRYDGFSNSDRRPSGQLGLYLWRPDGIYLGAELDQVRFNDGGPLNTEVDLYGGRGVDLAGSRFSLEAMAVMFPGQHGTGPTYDFAEVTAKVRHPFGPLALDAVASWSPQGSYHSGRFLKLAGAASYQAAPWMTLSAQLGTRNSQRSQDRTFWDAGATFKRRNLEFDLRYVATNLRPQQCFFSDRCEPAVIGKLTVSLPSKPTKKGTDQ